MRISARAILLSFATLVLLARPAGAQTVCPPGHPSAPWPGPAFVPTADCQGWIPANHPMAPQAPPTAGPSGEMPPASLVGQAIYTAIEMPTTVSAAGGGIRAIGGWAVDCALGAYPPVIRVTETKPDGSTRDIPNDYFYGIVPRADVQAGIGGACPAVYHMPASDGADLGPNQLFGWGFALRSPITEIGVHTFTVVFAWPAQLHSGSSSIAVNIVR